MWSAFLQAWLAMAKVDPARINVEEWESAVKALSSTHGGVVCRENMKEEQFIDKVIMSISSIVRPLLRYSVSHLSGHERITQVVADLFQKVPKAPHFDARVLGFSGIGGQGKTTTCKLMINYYRTGYAGRCALIEFPSTGCNEKVVAAQCNAALEQLTMTDQCTGMHQSNDFDQCLERLKRQGLSGRDVFIAIDNVWEDSLKFAQRILDLGFGSGSTVMVTSRSRQVLLTLLKDERCVKRLPGLTRDEAGQIFAKAFHRNEGVHGVELEDADVQAVTKSMLYGGLYHPLAINAAGVGLGRTRGREWQAAWRSKPYTFTGSGSDTDKMIRLNYESIPKSRQDIFLDVALIYIPHLQDGSMVNFFYHRELEPESSPSWHLRTWLTAVNVGVMDEHEINSALVQLAYDGLLEFEGGEGRVRVRVYDLYKELASLEGPTSQRFAILSCESSSASRGMNRRQVGRMVCTANWEASTSGEWCEGKGSFPKLQVLLARGFLKWKVAAMPEVRVLQVRAGYVDHCRGWRGWGGCMPPKLAWLELSIGIRGFYRLGLIRAISGLRNLRILKLVRESPFTHSNWSVSSHLRLEGLVNLQFFTIQGLAHLGEISGLGSLTNLQYLYVQGVPRLSKAGSFHSPSMKKLQCLIFFNCPCLKDVAGVVNLTSLRVLCLCNVRAWPDLRGMPALEGLRLGFGGDGRHKAEDIIGDLLATGLRRLITLHLEGLFGTVDPRLAPTKPAEPKRI